MLAKLIVGIAGFLVLGAGVFLYYENSDLPCSGQHSCCSTKSANPAATAQKSCCSMQDLQTSQAVVNEPETLEVSPREVATVD